MYKYKFMIFNVIKVKMCGFILEYYIKRDKIGNGQERAGQNISVCHWLRIFL